MKVAVFGLGYVGCVSAACLAHREHEVIGVDTNAQKVSMVHAGKAPLLEPGLAELMAAEAAAGRLDATTDAAEAVMRSEISVICVGTPSAANGSLSLDAVERVARSIGEALFPRASARR
jgi:GDP-mannose 6-dehydrogenase